VLYHEPRAPIPTHTLCPLFNSPPPHHPPAPCRQYLRELRDYQQQIKLFDESAEEIVREALRKQVGGSSSGVVLACKVHALAAGVLDRGQQ
jgi:hypothetical protein